MRLLRFVQQTALNRGRSQAHAKPADQTQPSFLFRNTGKPRIAQDTAKITDRLIVDQDHCTPEKY